MLDKRTRLNLQNVAQVVWRDGWDYPFLIDGGERNGKSSILLDVLLAVDGRMPQYLETEDYEPILSHVAWTFKDWTDLIIKSRDTCIAREETDVYGREAMRPINLQMMRIMSRMGKRHLVMPILYPDSNDLDPAIRRRARARYYVFAKHNLKGVPERGYFLVYVRRRYPWRNPDGTSVWFQRAYQGSYVHLSKGNSACKELWSRFEEQEDRVKDALLKRRGKREDEDAETDG